MDRLFDLVGYVAKLWHPESRTQDNSDALCTL